MSISITVKEHSKNGNSNIIAAYYNGKNCDMVNNIPTMDMLSEFACKYKKPHKFTLTVYVNGSKTGMSFNFENEYEKRESALYATLSFLNMLSSINNA